MKRRPRGLLVAVIPLLALATGCGPSQPAAPVPSTPTARAPEPQAPPSTAPSTAASAAPEAAGADAEPEPIMMFGPGVTPPVPLRADEITFTEEARRAKVQGVMLVKCTIRSTGRATSCQVIKDVPLMRDAVLTALYARDYGPIRYEGRPVSIHYTFAIKLRMQGQ